MSSPNIDLTREDRPVARMLRLRLRLSKLPAVRVSACREIVASQFYFHYFLNFACDISNKLQSFYVPSFVNQKQRDNNWSNPHNFICQSLHPFSTST